MPLSRVFGYGLYGGQVRTASSLIMVADQVNAPTHRRCNDKAIALPPNIVSDVSHNADSGIYPEANMKKSNKNKAATAITGTAGQTGRHGVHKAVPNVPIRKPFSMVTKIDMITALSFAVTGNDDLMCQQIC